MEIAGFILGIICVAVIILLWKYADIFSDGNVSKDKDFNDSEVFFK